MAAFFILISIDSGKCDKIILIDEDFEWMFEEEVEDRETCVLELNPSDIYKRDSIYMIDGQGFIVKFTKDGRTFECFKIIFGDKCVIIYRYRQK